MKNLMLVFLIFGTSFSIKSQPLHNATFNNDYSVEKELDSKDFYFDFDVIWDLFDESDIFLENSSFLWADYQPLSNRASRENFTGVRVPPLGIHYEKRLFHNLGARISYSAHWWKEDIVLVQSSSTEFSELFKYYYNTFWLGLTWHFSVSDIIDPYLGMGYSYRNIHATCNCISETIQDGSFDLLIGARIILGERLFFSGEIGHLGVGYFKVGAGVRLGDF